MPSLGLHPPKLVQDHHSHGLARAKLTQLTMLEALERLEALQTWSVHANNMVYAL